jgi:hypothetical protein
MTALGATLSTFDPIFKEDYLGPLQEALNSKTVLLKRIKKVRETFGVDAIHVNSYGRNRGIGARGEGGVLPNPGAQKFMRTLTPLRRNYGRIKIDGPVIAAARSDKGAFARAIDYEMKGLERDLPRDMNRQLFRASTGVLAQCGTTSASATVQLATTGKMSDMRWLEVDMHIDILVITSGAVVIADEVITAVDTTNHTITIGTAVTTSSSHAIYQHGSRNLEMMGLDGIISETDPDHVDFGAGVSSGAGDLQNANVSTYPFWKAIVISNSGTAGTNAPVEFSKIQRVVDRVDIKTGESPKLAICHHYVRSEIAKQLLAGKFIFEQTMLDGGFSGIKYTTPDGGSITFVTDRDCFPKTTIYFPREDALQFCRQADFSWMDKDGAVLCRCPDEDAYEATLFVYQELSTSMRNVHARLDDIEVVNDDDEN